MVVVGAVAAGAVQALTPCSPDRREVLELRVTSVTVDGAPEYVPSWTFEVRAWAEGVVDLRLYDPVSSTVVGAFGRWAP